ncbi:heme ABC transporter ATP-binding protein [Ravibacter arvi]|uniref:Heme ABC transporter ATP-binding protein n=1 Tax=Ravibacter arvi TaxID=2051041 RepID=A0ABP8LTC1_9BACT
MMEILEVGYKANGRSLITDVSLRIEAGRFVAIVGPNGAGKSTFLKLLTGELTPACGSIRLEGRDLKRYRQPELARRRAVLAQQNHVSLPFSVREIVMMGRYPFHKNAPEERDFAIVEACLREVEMLGLADRVFPTLSGGEQQRAQLAKALAQIWEITGAFLFLDEPTNGLDLRHQCHSLEIARQLAGKGTGVVAVLHDLNMALQYADEVVMMQHGKVYAKGRPEETLTEENIRRVFDVQVRLVKLPESGERIVLEVGNRKSAIGNQESAISDRKSAIGK